MPNKKAFTLVELIVVITVLSILSTIAYISFTLNTQNTKNSKISADLRTLVTAIETGITKGSFGLLDIVTDDPSNTYDVNSGSTITYLDSFGESFTGSISSLDTYKAGTITFSSLGQSDTAFNSADENPYLVAVASKGKTIYYQIAGQVAKENGTYVSLVKGTYIPKNLSTDVEGLIADASGFYPNGVGDETDLSTNGLY